jgi:ribosome biogenesis protein Nip4
LRLLRRFLEQVGSKMDPEVLMIDSKRFTLGQEMGRQRFSRENLVYAGTYLGRNRRLFEPGSPLLQMLAAEEGTRKVHLDRDAAWLFVCGRDVFEESIRRVEGALELGGIYLVMFDGRCVGYGRFETSAGIHVIRNLFDLGDFLRREDSG